MRSVFRWMPLTGILLLVAAAAPAFAQSTQQHAVAKATLAAVKQDLGSHDKRVGEMTAGTTVLLNGLGSPIPKVVGDGLVRELTHLKDLARVFKVVRHISWAEEDLLEGKPTASKSEIAQAIKEADETLVATEKSLRSQRAQREQYAAALAQMIDSATNSKPGSSNPYTVLKERLAPAALDREIGVLRGVLGRLNSNLKLI